jgi:hypothetical protein
LSGNSRGQQQSLTNGNMGGIFLLYCSRLSSKPQEKSAMTATLTLRRWHTYIGLFTAPSVLFFSLTGAVQLFNLHEAHGHYRPTPLIQKLSAVHKDQVYELPHEHDQADEGAAGKVTDERGTEGPAPEAARSGQGPGGAGGDQHGDKPADAADDEPAAATLVLKFFFLFVALALCLSTSFGIWIGVVQTRQPRTAWTLLISGTLIPILLVMLA